MQPFPKLSFPLDRSTLLSARKLSTSPLPDSHLPVGTPQMKRMAFAIQIRDLRSQLSLIVPRKKRQNAKKGLPDWAAPLMKPGFMFRPILSALSSCLSKTYVYEWIRAWKKITCSMNLRKQWPNLPFFSEKEQVIFFRRLTCRASSCRCRDEFWRFLPPI